MAVLIAEADATAPFVPHALHGADRSWPETNCYTDLWIELLHALGTEPLAGAAFSVACDFEGRQWSFFKPPLEDLFSVYGIRVGEMNVWRPVLDHVDEQLSLGALLTVEVDAWYLPDTVGTSYRREHVKTSIVPQALDRPGRRMGYFHARGYYELEGDDFDGIASPLTLPPYVELVRLPDAFPGPAELVAASLRSLVAQVGRLPATNPVTRMGTAIAADLPGLIAAGAGSYHLYAFGTLRQCGAGAAMAADYVRWLATATGADLEPVAAAFSELAEGAKTAQFSLARAARGRTVSVGEPIEAMAKAWDEATHRLAAHPIIRSELATSATGRPGGGVRRRAIGRGR